MGSYVDFQKLKATITIVQVLEMLDIKNLTPHGQALRGECPLCQVTNPRGFIVTPAKNSFYCFSEKVGGDIIELAARFWRVTQKEGAQRIAKHFGQDGGAEAPAPEPTAKPAADAPASGFDAAAYQASLDPAHVALKDCGFPEQTIRDFDGGYCAKGLNRGRLVLPVHDAGGSILAFMGLALKEEQPDILYPKGFQPPTFFNLHRVGEGTLYMVQTPRDVLRAWSASLVDVVCPLVPLTPASLEVLTAFMRERGFDAMEVY